MLDSVVKMRNDVRHVLALCIWMCLSGGFAQQDGNYYLSNGGAGSGSTSDGFVPSYQQLTGRGGYYQPQVPAQSYRQQNFPRPPAAAYQPLEVQEQELRQSQRFAPQQTFAQSHHQPAPFQLPPNAHNTPAYASFLLNEAPVQPAPFQSRQQTPAATAYLAASTQRPPYSRQHNLDPSQTETFLGQITIQSPNTDFSRNVPQFRPSTDFQYQQPQSLVDQFSQQQKWRTQHFPVNTDNADQDLEDYNDEQQNPETGHRNEPFLRKKPKSRVKSPSRGNLLTPQRTRFTPDHQGRSYKSGHSQNDYFAGNNAADVYTTARNRFKPKLTTTTEAAAPTSAHVNRFSPSRAGSRGTTTYQTARHKPIKHTKIDTTEATFALNIEPLLEDQVVRNNYNVENDNVEVVQSNNPTSENSDYSDAKYEKIPDSQSQHQDLGDYPDSDIATTPEQQAQTLPTSTEDYYYAGPDTTEEDVTLGQGTIDEANLATDHDHYEKVVGIKEENTATSTLDLSAIEEPVDEDEDAQVEEGTTENSNEQHSTATNVETTTESVTNSDGITHADATTLPDTTDEQITEQQAILLGEAVVSVVTTKSVINGTISIPPVTVSSLSVTEQMQPPPDAHDNLMKYLNNTTESWVVVASVQTSRSVSGARFLPFENVEHDDETKLDTEEETDSTDAVDINSFENSNDDSNEVRAIVPITTSTSAPASSTTTEAPASSTTTQAPASSTTTEAPASSTTTPASTESIIDKLDRVQSELSSGFLAGGFRNGNNNITVITEHMTDKSELNSTTMANDTEKPSSTQGSPVFIRKFSAYSRPTTTSRPIAKKPSSLLENIKMDDLSGLLPANFKPRYTNRRTTTTTPKIIPLNLEKPQGDQPYRRVLPETGNRNVSGRSFGKPTQNKIAVQDDIAAFLPPGYKLTQNKITVQDDITALLPPGYKQPTNEQMNKSISVDKLATNAKNQSTVKNSVLQKPNVIDDLSAFLPPGYKLTTSTERPHIIDSLLQRAQPLDVNAFLPPGYKVSSTTEQAIAKPAFDISALLPPGYKLNTSTEKPPIHKLLENAKTVDISALLPPGFKLPSVAPAPASDSSAAPTPAAIATSTTPALASNGGLKVVFPSRPGGRKPISRATTQKSLLSGDGPGGLIPTIRKGLPTRATTEFTGWPTPSTTPISIEKLLEAARTATGSTSSPTTSTSTTSTTTTTTTTTTTPKPTTPGLCVGDCDLAGTIKLVGGAKWVPELLDHNTKEWQLLANEVQTQLENVYSKSDSLNRWYKKIRIDGFSEGSVLVDYFVELNDLSRQVDTQELKRLFHSALHPVSSTTTDNNDNIPEGEESEDDEMSQRRADMAGKLNLGSFIVDPTYTDFIVLPKQIAPTVGYADENVFLPQWAIAVIVIGLASLLFVIIFGVTVLVNRQKNAKKRQPTPLTEDMLNELNKNHMGGLDNYGAEDLYNMEDVWNDRPYEAKPPKKRSAGSLHDNSMSNLYDSWRSEWNGYYYNAYYGNPGSSGSAAGYARRRSDYDTNF